MNPTFPTQAAPRPSSDLTELATRPMNELLAFIERRYHDELRVELPALVALAHEVERIHVEKETCPRGLAAHLETMHEQVADHLAKEEQVLFPLIRAGRGPMAAAPIQMMEREHEDHHRALRRLRELTTGYEPPPEACASWRDLYLRLDRLASDLMEHIHVENDVVFPRALCA